METDPWAEPPLEGVEGVGLPETLGVGCGTCSQASSPATTSWLGPRTAFQLCHSLAV